MLIVLYVTSFMATVNENVTNTALVSIMADFGVTTESAQWLVTGYMIVVAIVVVFVGFFLQRFTIRQLFIAWELILISGSFVCMFAPNFQVLLAGRLFTAAGTGIAVPAAIDALVKIAPRERLATYMSISSSTVTLGPALAPVISGFIVVWLGWRAIFATPIILAVGTLVAGLFLVKPVSPTRHVKLDIVSLALAAVGLSFFVIGINTISINPKMGAVQIVVGVAVIAAFLVRQGHIPEPMLNMSPLKVKWFGAALIMPIITMMTFFALCMLLPLYMEAGAGISAFSAGALMLIPIFINATSSIVSGRVMDRRGVWPLLTVGFSCIMIGLAIMWRVSLTQMVWPVIALTALVFAGCAMPFASTQTAALGLLPDEESTQGVAMFSALIQVAGCVGPALLAGAYIAAPHIQGVSEAAAGLSSACLLALILAAVGLVISIAFSLTHKKQR